MESAKKHFQGCGVVAGVGVGVRTGVGVGVALFAIWIYITGLIMPF